MMKPVDTNTFSSPENAYLKRVMEGGLFEMTKTPERCVYKAMRPEALGLPTLEGLVVAKLAFANRGPKVINLRVFTVDQVRRMIAAGLIRLLSRPRGSKRAQTSWTRRDVRAKGTWPQGKNYRPRKAG